VNVIGTIIFGRTVGASWWARWPSDATAPP